MEWPELPGVVIDVGVLLRCLAPEALTQAVKVASADPEDPNQPSVSTLRLRARGLALDVHVPELLRGLEPQQLHDALRAAAEAWPAGKQLLQDEFLRLVAVQNKSTCADASVRLPQIGSIGRPPRLPSSNRGVRTGMVADRSASLATLPRVAPSVSSGLVAAVHERGDTTFMGEQLRRAVRAKDLPKVETLIASRADLEVAGPDGSAPSALAMVQGTPHGILRVLLEAKADVHKRDGQGRSLPHLWSWTLPKSRAGLREEQKKLALLVRFSADLNARLPATGDTPLHVLARVFNALSIRVADGPDPNCNLDLGDSQEADKFAQGTQFRIQLLVGSGAEVTTRNNAGRKPLDLVERRFWPLLVQLAGTSGTREPAEGQDGKVRRVRLDGGHEVGEAHG